jgi:hypothetical protein
MNATRVSIPAARRPGKLLTAAFLLLTAFRPAKAAEITITVTGTLAGGNDYFGVFGMGRSMPAGTPFTLIYTIDDSVGGPMYPGSCPNAMSGTSGAREHSPVTAVLTVARKSYEFGRRPDAKSSAWRYIATGCSQSEIGINITEGRAPLEMGISIRINPNQGAKSLTQDGDWRKAISLSNFYARNTFNSFAIRRPGNNMGGTQSYLVVKSLTVSGPQKANR